jgi:hypothetical protein
MIFFSFHINFWPFKLEMGKRSWHIFVAIATLGHHALANPLGYRNVLGNASLNTDQLFGRDIEDFDPADLSFITKMAAIGDSYSAGIGAGDRLGSIVDDYACIYFPLA